MKIKDGIELQIFFPQNGFVSALPYLCMWLFSMFISVIADWMLSSGRFNHTQVRKIINSIGKIISLRSFWPFAQYVEDFWPARDGILRNLSSSRPPSYMWQSRGMLTLKMVSLYRWIRSSGRPLHCGQYRLQSSGYSRRPCHWCRSQWRYLFWFQGTHTINNIPLISFLFFRRLICKFRLGFLISQSLKSTET